MLGVSTALSGVNLQARSFYCRSAAEPLADARGTQGFRETPVENHWSRESRLGLLKSTFNAENLVHRLSQSISSHFGALLKCVSQPKIAKNSLKPPILGVQGHSRSSMLTLLKSSLPVLVTMSSMSAPVCNHFHVRRANSSRIMSF